MTEPLTARQVEVLAAYLRHQSYRAAAAELGLAEQTVRSHLRQIYTRLGVDGHLAAAVALGWLQIPRAA